MSAPSCTAVVATARGNCAADEEVLNDALTRVACVLGPPTKRTNDARILRNKWDYADTTEVADVRCETFITHCPLALWLLPLPAAEFHATEEVSTMTDTCPVDELRVPASAPVRSSVRIGVDLTRVAPHGQSSWVTPRYSVGLSGGNKPAAIADVLTLVAA